jgi:hypothetical protein
MGKVGLVALLSAIAGCATGRAGSSTEPEEAAVASSEEPAQRGLISPEAYDELRSTFERKRPMVARCYAEAMEKGTLDKAAKGRVTLGLAISARGKVSEVHVTNTTLKSDEVESCVVALVGTWALPAPGSECEFSFSYDFEAE